MEREEIYIPWKEDRNMLFETPLFLLRAAREVPNLASLIKEHKKNYKYMHRRRIDRSDAMVLKLVFSNDSKPPYSWAPHNVTTQTIG